ncbi:retropepsin-like aspartic protease [uncultured Paraglaciecola sp.]|jgi:clan AA aspartic protease (TIGR02281 family)|uniref:retropepsin-like aspartic protease family protein n=1 Tax=uncultured Paraglaciecola sp. TaxID=1765024 RepID=UPI0025EE3204|nr:retropepsin-like aspartic protease [uncultured Paraglaciecola sp.]
MKSWTALLSILLCLSLGLNLYLLFGTSSINSVQPNKTQQQAAYPLANKMSDEQSAEDNSNFNSAPAVTPAPQEAVINQDWQSTDRSELLNRANQMYLGKNMLDLSLLLQNYLKQHPQDMDFLLLEAKMKVETTLLSDAIAHYYDLLRNPMTAAQQSEIELQIKTLSHNSIEQLTRIYSWDVLAMFIEPLLQLAPDNRLYILSLAKAYAELYQEALMENVLASLDLNDPDAQKIRQIIVAQQRPETIDESPEQDNEVDLGRAINLKKYADQYVIQGSLSGNPVSLLIDTGASVTAISKQYFNRLSNRYKVNYLGRFSIGTAAGSIMASMYQFRELTFGHVTVENLPVVILPMGEFDNADGLLGMNFLREFDFKIDQRQSVIFIK